MIRHCDGTDPYLVGGDLASPCACGLTFDDVSASTVFPHSRIHGDLPLGQLPPGHRVPVPEDVQRLGNVIGSAVGRALPAGWGFGLFLFTYGEGGTMFWLSSAQRDDMVKALQEWMRAEGS